MGSVKEVIVEKNPTDKEEGVGVFRFSDDFSVFDYGKMPDVIEGKGEALNRTASYNFEQVKKLGVKSHFLEFVSGNEMKVMLVRVIDPKKQPLSEDHANYLVPLEIIFRNSLPAGSSVFKRIESGELSWEELGLNSEPSPNQLLKKPILEASTKLEETDRFLSWEEARELSGLTEQELGELKKTALKVNDYLNQKASSLGLVHADGKIECAMDSNRNLIVVDVFGTLDEDRFLLNAVHLSKQILRDAYLNTDWVNELNRLKEEGKPKSSWPAPPNLPKELIELVSSIYKSTCNEWTGERHWDVEPLKELTEKYLEWKQQK